MKTKKKSKLSAAHRRAISAAVKKAAKQRKQRLLKGEDFKADVKAAFSAGIDGGMPRVVDSKVDFNKTRLLGSRAVDPNVEIKNIQVACRQPENAGQQVDMVNHPPHYKHHPSGIEAITITRHMTFNVGSAMKYCWRANHKGNQIQDLEKAVWYLNDEIQRLKKEQAERQEKIRLACEAEMSRVGAEQSTYVVEFKKVKPGKKGKWKIAKNLASKVKDGAK